MKNSAEPLALADADPDLDAAWYGAQFPDVALSGLCPAEHWHRIGRHIGRPKGPATARGHVEPQPSFEILGEHVSSHRGPAVTLEEKEHPVLQFKGRLAVHLHLFHLDMLFQYQIWLASIEAPFDLYVSVAEADAAGPCEAALRSLPGLLRLHVELMPNRGRDIAPMVVGFGPRLAGYDLVVHFHSKKSAHTAAKRDWGLHLGHHLFHSKAHFTQILNLFADTPGLGLAFPVYHPSVSEQIKWGGNFARVAEEMLRLLGAESSPLTEADLLPFPAGSFFVARTEAIRPLLAGGFTLSEFEAEEGQVDGTLAHAIERMLPLATARRGFTFRQIRAEKPHSLSRSYLNGPRYTSDCLRRLETGEMAHVPSVLNPALAGLRITFFTCATAGYERSLPFESLVDGARYVFFTDTPGSSPSAQWDLRPLAVQGADQIRTARRHKTQPHLVLEDCDIAVWIDGNIAATGDLTPLIVQTLGAGAAFGVVPHPYRANVAEELSALIHNRMDDPGLMRAQQARYVTEGFPDDGGLTETNFMVMDLRRPETRQALDIWWSEIKGNSRRDQLSFDYACWKAGAAKTSLIDTGLSVRADPRFAYLDHGGTRHAHLDPLRELGESLPGQLIPDSDQLRVDVVICVHNSPDDVARCLHSARLARDGRTRMLIVDDGSAPATRRVIARHLVSCPSDILIRHDIALGYTRSANAGLKASCADYVILLNSDTIVPSGWVRALVTAGEADPDVGIVGPLSNAATWQSVPLAKDSRGDFALNALPEGVSLAEAARLCERIPAAAVYQSPIVNGFCFAIKRRVIDGIGYFDEEAFPQGYGEENDYCLRLSDIGMTCGITLSTYVYHAKSKSFSHERRLVLSQSGWESLVRKHGAERLSSAVRELQDHPALGLARSWFPALTCRHEPRAQAVGFYLPQFHPLAVNDRAWGPGFSEWRNVVKAGPRYNGHPQPRLPGELGYYDLRTAETLAAQGQLAQEFGLAAMAVYYYRFGSERLMGAVTDRLLSMPEGGPNFFYCWANEDWTRAWDGKTHEAILRQDYSTDTLSLFAQDLIEASADSRYFRIGDKPVVMIYQLNKLPDAPGTIHFLRERLRKSLGLEMVLGTTWNPDFRPEWEELVDFVAQFPPHRTPRRSERRLLARESLAGASEACGDFFESYDQVSVQSLEAVDSFPKLAPGICPDWDNSPRRARQANILVGSTPGKFEDWTRQAALHAIRKHRDGQLPAPLVFVNAWNEWAEGAVLEPTEKDGRAYLAALRRGLFASG
ncbi:hypothetical protein P775_06715 [Puniceibacterium antarcticum]|uniref:Glycosyltransferase 2-like domain-containing protein n=1 Tax=Puniceibacterium antarcticum TaxID=1206336 RepID=A0A2G8RHF6_9RHOB|nr:glycoside hydrolase family 99-like domain-containing protein [Puniceibacterium antarcticum]PIL20952.1 hypothetical protein P775_06715 [Puniceibacterium antarcticum]